MLWAAGGVWPYFEIALITAAFVMDALAGDPLWLPHPVRGIGFLIERGEPLFRRLLRVSARTAAAYPARERLAGSLLVLSVCAATFIVFASAICVARRFGAAFIVSVVIAYFSISPRCLRDEAMKVYRKAAAGDLEGARAAVSMIVGRDTENLSQEGVVKAAVETVAESLADGVIAPLFYLVLGGPALAMLYKAVNTLDSMIGYKNERYLHFGRSAAKLDDLLGWLPARIAARLMILAAALLRLDARNAAAVYRRDRLNHASPNSGHCEAVVAGALGLSLGGDAYYGGNLERKPRIGDALKHPQAFDIVLAVRLMYVSAALFVCLSCAVFAAAALVAG
jgi:adenosylcobinamide-phosphate synthase